MKTPSTHITRFVLALVAITGTAVTAWAEPPAHDGDPSSDKTGATTYSEVRAGIGAGGTTSGKEAAVAEEGVAVINASVIQRWDRRIIGANLAVQDSLFGATHAYLGGLVGIALGSGDAHMELLAEGGLHAITGMGNDLFDEARSNNSSAVLPYAGLQMRTVFDVGAPNGLQLELSVHGRTDLFHETRDIMIESCFFGCTTTSETWDVGGVSANAIAGLSYQFD